MVLMSFCPHCKGLLRPTKQNGKLILACVCGFTKELTETKSNSETFSLEKELKAPPKINPLANISHVCSRCGFTKAMMVTKELGERSTWMRVEPISAEFICGRCNHREPVD